MNITDLPIEVGIVLLNYLDIKSKINVYNSCNALRYFFAACHVRKLVFSRSTIATAKSLEQDLFQHLCHHVEDINLSGVPDLTADALKPLKDRLVRLKTLDITFTYIYLSDLVDICPSNLKNLSINFFKCPRKYVTDGVWETCKQLFKNKQFAHVHFVVFDSFDSDIPLMFLKDVGLIRDLQVTVADNYKDSDRTARRLPFTIEESFDANFSRLSYLFQKSGFNQECSRYLKGISNLDFQKYEYIFIMHSDNDEWEKITIYVSPILRSVFLVNCSDLKVETSPFLPPDFGLQGNIVFRAWNKNTTNFCDSFFKDLLLELKDWFPSYVCMHNNTSITMTITNAPNDWYCIDSCEGFLKKMEYLPEYVTLGDFCRKDGGYQVMEGPITLSPGAQTLNNITFLGLVGIFVQQDFFTLLFLQSVNLTTLDMEFQYGSNLKYLSKSIHFAKKLKNIKVTAEDIEDDILFEALSRCPTLENVHIYKYAYDERYEVNVSDILLFIKTCENLYSLYIDADMSLESVSLIRETAQKFGRDYLWVESKGWNPFEDVFNPSPLQILD